MGTNDNAQSAASITIGGNPLGSEGIPPTFPFTHPDMPSTSCDDNEGAPGPRPGPYCTEVGNSRLNERGDTNPDVNGNGSEYICAPSTERCPHGSHTEPGNQTGHGNPDANGNRDANARNPSGVSDAGIGMQGQHGGLSEAVVPEPTCDESGATDANPRNLVSAFDVSTGTQTKEPVHAVALLITLALLTQANTAKMALLTQEATPAHLSLVTNTTQGPA